jgi:hypothetical protein
MHACLSWPAADRFCTIELTEPQVVKRETIELSTDENGLLTYTVTGNLTEAPFEVLCTPGLCYEDTVMVYAGKWWQLCCPAGWVGPAGSPMPRQCTSSIKCRSLYLQLAERCRDRRDGAHHLSHPRRGRQRRRPVRPVPVALVRGSCLLCSMSGPWKDGAVCTGVHAHRCAPPCGAPCCRPAATCWSTRTTR